MAPVFKKVSMRWEGKDIDVTPTLRAVNDIEQVFDTFDLTRRYLSKGKPLPPSAVAHIVSACMLASGIDAAPEVLFGKLRFREGEEGVDRKALFVAANELLQAIVVDDSQGNDEAPDETKGAKKSKPSGGPSSTKSPSDTSESSQANSGG